MRYTAAFNWEEIEKVFLDLDGTLLDKYFDDYFWEHFLPQFYAEKNGVPLETARQKLIACYKKVENTLVWTDLNYWSAQLNLDVPALKKEVDHLVNIRPFAREFLENLRDMGKPIYLVTNAHPAAITIKMNRVDLRPYFTKIICSQDVGFAKEQTEFWHRLQQHISYNSKNTFFADDTEKVLQSAREYGFTHIFHIAKPSSRQNPRFSGQFNSITNFQTLLSNGDIS